MITISVCMIVKNEEKVLRRCLDSLKKIADEIIIVDTGSTDTTKEIAEKYTDKIYDFEWIDDFSAARNFSFSKASMDYIYVADADEIIDEENQNKFLQVKEVLLEEIDIVQMYYTNQLEFGTTYNFDKEYRPKLYKRIRKFEWIEPVHESVRLDPIIYDSEIEIIHKAHENHANRDFKIYQKLIKSGTKLSSKLLGMYARELYISGEEKDFLDAHEYFLYVVREENRSLDDLKMAQCIVAKSALFKNDISCFFTYCLKDAVTTSCSEICYELGEYYVKQSDFKEAYTWYYNAAFETQSILNIHYSGDYPLKRLIQCCKELGFLEEAKMYELQLG